MSVQELIRNKKYKIDIPIGYNGNKRIRHIETFYGGKKDAILRENELKIQLKNNTFVRKNNITMKELTDEWLKSKKSSIAQKTYIEYERICNTINLDMGHLKVSNINCKVLEDFYNDLRTKEGRGKTGTGYSEKTIKHHYTVLTEVFNCAIKWGYIIQNPNSSVTPIKVHKKEIQCYTPAEVNQLLEVLKNEPIKYQAIIMLAIDSGCRRGELTGLNWEDVILEKDQACININKTTQYLKDIGVFEKRTKSDSSNRTIFISNTTMEVLKKYKLEQNKLKLQLGDKWKNSKKVFTTEYGDNMHPDTPSKILNKIINKYNLKRISFHGLRHTSISLQIASGIQTQIISKRAGHSSISVTHNVYSHFFDNEMKEVANKMDELLNQKAN